MTWCTDAALAPELLSAAIASHPVGTLILDARGRVCWANEAATRFGQQNLDELVGDVFGRAAGCVRAHEGCSDSPVCHGCPLRAMIQQTLTDGRSIHMRELSRPFERPGVLDTPRVLASSSLTRVDGVAHVVLTLQALRSNDAPEREPLDLLTVTNALAEALFTVRLPERVIEYVNREAEQLFGWSARVLIGSPTSVLYPDQQAAEAFGQKLAAALAQQQPQLRTEHTFVRRDGRTFIGAVSTTFLFDGPTPSRVISVVSDISARKRMELELARSEKRYRALFDLAPVGIALFDVPSGRHLASNARHCELLGYMPEQLMLQPWQAHTHPDDLAAEAEALARLRRGGDVVEFEKRLIRANGTFAYVRSTATLLGEGPDAGLAMVISEDLSARRTLDAEKLHIAESLRDRQKLDSLGMLAGGIAHDFNNILGVVTINTDLMRRQIPADSSLRHRVDIISDAITRATDLTRQLLAYAGQGRLQVEAVDPSVIIFGMEKLLRLSISSKTELDFDLAAVSVVEADTTQLRQVIMNLVINASQALPEGRGRVSVRLRERELDEPDLHVVPKLLLPPGRYVLIEVEDAGHGIPQEQITHIFDPFYTTKAKGHGLGLSAILGIVKSHRGGVQVESTVGVGSRFRVLLPAGNAPAQAQPQQPDPEERWRGRGRVLIVDDEPVLRLATREMLEHLGFEVDEARHGQDAIDQLCRSERPFEFVLLDLTMPVMDGLEALERMRELGIQVPVILVSGFRRNELSGRYVSAGFSGFLHKPYDMRELTEAVRRVQSPRT